MTEFACSLVSNKENTLEVPCLGYLNEAVLIGAVASGNQSVRLVGGKCNECELAPGLQAAIITLRRATRILSLFGMSPEFSLSFDRSAECPQRGGEEHFSRRDFFSYLRSELRSRMEGRIDDGGGADTAMKTQVALEPKLPKNHIFLLEQVRRLGHPLSNRADAASLPFADVEISRNCNGCGMCVTFCPTGALSSRNDDNKQAIEFTSAHCIACNLCSDICPQGAITLSAIIDIPGLLSGNRKTLVEHEKSTCTLCGDAYVVTSRDTLCPACKKKEAIKWSLVRR